MEYQDKELAESGLILVHQIHYPCDRRQQQTLHCMFFTSQNDDIHVVTAVVEREFDHKGLNNLLLQGGGWLGFQLEFGLFSPG